MLSIAKPFIFLISTLLFTATVDVSMVGDSSASGENMIEEIIGKDRLMSPQQLPDGCADNLDPEALKIVELANRDFWIKGKTQDAAMRLEKAITLEPRLYAAYPNLKLHYCWALKQCDRAITILEKAISYCPNWPGYNVELGGTYAKMGQYDLALEEYTRAQAKGITESASFFFNLGNTHGHLKHYDEAITNFYKTLDMNIKHFNARKNLIVTFVMQNENQKALKQLEILLSLEPDEEMKLWAMGAREHLLK